MNHWWIKHGEKISQNEANWKKLDKKKCGAYDLIYIKIKTEKKDKTWKEWSIMREIRTVAAFGRL